MDLLEEILLEILSKLPVKSLLRFKSVSKSWHSLISDPRLAELNLLHHRSRPREALDVAMYAYIIDAQAWRLRSYKLVGDEITRVGPDPFDTGEIQDDTQIMFCDEQILDGTRIMYCEGLLCFVRFHRFHVCNPTTGEMESLPGIVSDTFYPEDFGFGYDPMRKEYKVVRRRPCNRDGRRVFRFQVFTLGGGGGWRYLVQTIDLVRSVTSVCLDGVIHWISRSKLVTFNVGDECLGEIAVPGVFGKVSPCKVMLVVLDGKLCLAHTDRRSDELNIWMLMDRTGCSWIKGYCIKPRLCGMPWNVRPVCLWRKRILLHQWHRLFLYDPETRTFSEVRGDWGLLVLITDYVESLVAVKRSNAACFMRMEL